MVKEKIQLLKMEKIKLFMKINYYQILLKSKFTYS